MTETPNPDGGLVSKSPGFSVTIVAFNNAESIGESVRQAMRLSGCRSVIVVDNGGDGSASIAAAAGAIVVERPDNPGFGAAQNAAVALADTPFVLLLNPDAELVGDAPRIGLAQLEKDGRTAAVQGIVTSRRTGRPERSMGSDIRWIHLVGRAVAARRLLSTRLGRRLATLAGVGDHVDRVPAAPIRVETLAATALLIRKEAFDAVGGFDDRYFLYGEDLDLCRRLRLGGWELVGLPIPWASHADGSTAESNFEREITWWNGTMQYAAMWWSTPHWMLALVAAAVQWGRLAAARPLSAGRVRSELLAAPRRFRNERKTTG